MARRNASGKRIRKSNPAKSAAKWSLRERGLGEMEFGSYGRAEQGTSTSQTICTTIAIRSKRAGGKRRDYVKVLLHIMPTHMGMFKLTERELRRRATPSGLVRNVNLWRANKGRYRDSVLRQVRDVLESGGTAQRTGLAQLPEALGTKLPHDVLVDEVIDYVNREKAEDAKVEVTVRPGSEVFGSEYEEKLDALVDHLRDHRLPVREGGTGKVHKLKVRGSESRTGSEHVIMTRNGKTYGKFIAGT